MVYADHNPLVFLHRMYNQNQRLKRLALIVQGYNLVIRQKKGSENVCVRMPFLVCDVCSYGWGVTCVVVFLCLPSRSL